MRLLRFVDGRLTLTNFSGRTVPPYAILSHRWSEDCNDEVLFEDLGTDAWITKANSPKIVFCAGRAAEDGLEYFWIDTCCIDKWDRDELSKAVNSMFRWYQNAFKCYVYLSDVLWSSGEHAGQQRPWEAAFRESCWFKRGWTLQELIAPASVEFFTSDGQRVGDKESLEQIIHEITGIPDQALQCSSLHEFSVSDRIAWLGDRRTTEPEDAAYCLLGILNISMPLSYGEGKEKALSRLREELQATADSPSIIPFSQNERFVGREAELAEIESQLFTDKHSTRIAITGEGGTGKSQLALEIAHRLRRKNKHCSVFWVDVSSIDSLWQGYSSIAEKLKLPGWDDEKADVMELVRIHLSGEKVGQWLLVFDNVDNLDLVPAEYAKRKPTNLVNYLPQCELGCILFTTTNSKAAETLALQNIMELHEMTPETAERMLASHVIDRRLGDEKHEMQTLLYELLYLPLAIVQAAAYINITGITLKEYRSRLDKHKEEALQLYNARSIDTRQAESLRDPITSTLLTTLYQLLQDHRLASNYLFLMACIDRRDIPLNMLDTDLAKEREDAVRVLNDYALITRRPADDALDLHRLVHQTTRAWLQKQEWFSERTEKAAGRLAEIFPSDNDGSRSKWRRLLPHARCVLSYSKAGQENEVRTGLSWKCAMALLRDGQYSESGELFERVMETFKRVLGEEHPSTLTSMANLASTFWNQGRWKEAEELFVRVMETFKRVLGEEHPSTLTSMANLASTYRNQGRWKEAEELEVRVMETRKRVLGEEHPSTLTSMNNLAFTWKGQGRDADALRLMNQCLELLMKVLGMSHPNTVSALTTLLQWSGVDLESLSSMVGDASTTRNE